MDGLSCIFTEYTNLLDQPLIVRLYFCDKVIKIAYPILLKLAVWVFWNLIFEMCHNWMKKGWKGDEDWKEGKTLKLLSPIKVLGRRKG